MFFFSVGEAATSKWTHEEVAVFGSTVYKIFALKCQKLRTPLASLALCVKLTSSIVCPSKKIHNYTEAQSRREILLFLLFLNLLKSS